MILSCVTAYELMQCTLNSPIFYHFIVHLVLKHTINVVTWLYVQPSYVIDFMTTTVPNIDFDTNRRLISKSINYDSKRFVTSHLYTEDEL